MGRGAIIAGVAAGVLAGAPAALATSQTASFGNVTATFKYAGNPPNTRHERLTITRAGTMIYDQPVTSSFCASLCGPGSEGGSSSSVQVLDLEHNGSPDVVLDLYSG